MRLTRIHMEEDAGKNLHAAAGVSFVDYNRAGVPLCEIVSEPDVRSAEEAAGVRARGARRWCATSASATATWKRARCAATPTCRCARAARTKYGTKTELKNMNSFKNVRDAIEHEVKRQAALLDRGERVVQETRLWDAARGVTQAMRSKEQAHDYRYFPEPDLPPLVVDRARAGRKLRAQPARAARGSLRALHQRRGSRRKTRACWSPSARSPAYFDADGGRRRARQARRQLAHQRGARARRRSAQARATPTCPVPPAALAELVASSRTGTLSGKLGKDVFARMWTERRAAGEIVAAEGLAQVSDSGALEEACKRVVAAHPDEAGRFRANPKLMGFFVGAVMKETGGKANPKAVNEILRQLLGLTNGRSRLDTGHAAL